MAKDRRVTTWLSKQAAYDYDAISNDYIVGESDYVVICMRPDERALLLATLNFHAEFSNRWLNFPSEITRVDLLARANESLIKEMACSEDIEQLNSHLASIALSLTEIRDRLAPVDNDLDTRLTEIRTAIDSLDTTLSLLDPSLVDNIEGILDGVGVILGAAQVLNGA